jgi:hypothetical protein
MIKLLLTFEPTNFDHERNPAYLLSRKRRKNLFSAPNNKRLKPF